MIAQGQGHYARARYCVSTSIDPSFLSYRARCEKERQKREAVIGKSLGLSAASSSPTSVAAAAPEGGVPLYSPPQVGARVEVLYEHDDGAPPLWYAATAFRRTGKGGTKMRRKFARKSSASAKNCSFDISFDSDSSVVNMRLTEKAYGTVWRFCPTDPSSSSSPSPDSTSSSASSAAVAAGACVWRCDHEYCCQRASVMIDHGHIKHGIVAKYVKNGNVRTFHIYFDDGSFENVAQSAAKAAIALCESHEEQKQMGRRNGDDEEQERQENDEDEDSFVSMLEAQEAQEAQQGSRDEPARKKQRTVDLAALADKTNTSNTDNQRSAITITAP